MWVETRSWFNSFYHGSLKQNSNWSLQGGDPGALSLYYRVEYGFYNAYIQLWSRYRDVKFNLSILISVFTALKRQQHNSGQSFNSLSKRPRLSTRNEIVAEETPLVPIEDQTSSSNLPQVIDVHQSLWANTAVAVSTCQQESTHLTVLQDSIEQGKMISISSGTHQMDEEERTSSTIGEYLI